MYDHKSDIGRFGRTIIELQAIVKRPDGSVIRPCASLGENKDSIRIHDLSESEIKNLVLKGYEKIEESEILDVWVEFIEIKPTSTVFIIFPKPTNS